MSILSLCSVCIFSLRYAKFLASTSAWSYKAIPIYEKLINTVSKLGFLKKDLALVYMVNSNKEMAIKLLKEYIKLYPQDEEAPKMLNAIEKDRVEKEIRTYRNIDQEIMYKNE